jgi:tRNA(Ile)-lysidine synthetase-like protein
LECYTVKILDMIDYLDIYNYWKSHPNYWISIDNKEKADFEIYSKFYEITSEHVDRHLITGTDTNTNTNTNTNTDLNNSKNIKSFIGYIILYDQFHRHFNRYLNLGDYNIVEYRQNAVDVLNQKSNNFFLELDEDDLYFCLMPYKHLGHHLKCINLCIEWTKYKNKIIKECSILSKFFNDTYSKYYTLERIKSNINTVHNIEYYNPDKICDYYPEKYLSKDWFDISKTPITYNPLTDWYENLKQKTGDKKIIVSLSGGVDSMVILWLLKNLDVSVSAAHIVYGNREISQEEYSFIATYCDRLSVPLFSYRIEFLKRDCIDRAFYEKMTRDIRFNVYKSIENVQNPVIILGHIQDDVIENIWTNLSKCQHLHNLGKMNSSEIQENVQIERPFLNTKKNEIYNLSEKFGIPYLKNTTPLWSNRGKFREKFYKASHDQFGEIVDKNIVMVANIIKSQYEIIEKIVYRPILESFNNNKLDITLAIESNLDLSGWTYIIENVCHNYAKIAKPSFCSIQQFVKRLNTNSKEKNQLYQMKYNYQFLITFHNNKTILDIIIKK